MDDKKVDMSKEGEIVQMLANVWNRYVDLFPEARRSDLFLYYIQRCQKLLMDELADAKSKYYQ
jgi:hypothetical protein